MVLLLTNRIVHPIIPEHRHYNSACAGQIQQEKHIELEVKDTDAVVKPEAVPVHLVDAVGADGAVVGPGGFPLFAL